MNGLKMSPSSGGPVAAGLIDDLVAAYHVLAQEGVLDSFGHVSIRHPNHAERYLISRSTAPATVTADDIMEFDLDSNPVDARGRSMYLERYIHGEVYKARPDVMAVVHSHSPGVIPFSVTQVPLRAIFHNGSFLGDGVPVFEIRKAVGERNNMLVDGPVSGKALAECLGHCPVALMRGHGDVVVGPNLEVTVFRAIYTEVNARLQIQAAILGGPITFLNQYEAAKPQVTDRPWAFWKSKLRRR
ncbi:MAG TPA: class II aldolase/adducin family protein [Xanthobacteraceae bacterium]|jgi:HCOMODA/2-hydroxy-3-carboxy-muconic semialdehyde decarboxylase|nr:class II aldolase/adducin family protein [Xanthobacteraceae bacterium]